MSQDLGINVSDGVRVALSGVGLENIFKNPTNDPKIAGMLPVNSLEILNKVGPLAFQYSKEVGKPVVLIINSKA